MPLAINVGLSRKASKDYQSTGVSINVSAELDQTLLAKPDELQKQVADLYQQAQTALDRQAGGMATGEPSRGGRSYRDTNGNGNGRNGHRNGGGGGRMTDSQRRAINSISDRLGIDARLEARDIIGLELDELGVRDASELIDHLKAIQPSGNGRPSRN